MDAPALASDEENAKFSSGRMTGINVPLRRHEVGEAQRRNYFRQRGFYADVF